MTAQLINHHARTAELETERIMRRQQKRRAKRSSKRQFKKEDREQ